MATNPIPSIRRPQRLSKLMLILRTNRAEYFAAMAVAIGDTARIKPPAVVPWPRTVTKKYGPKNHTVNIAALANAFKQLAVTKSGIAKRLKSINGFSDLRSTITNTASSPMPIPAIDKVGNANQPQVNPRLATKRTNPSPLPNDKAPLMSSTSGFVIVGRRYMAQQRDRSMSRPV